MSNLVSLSLLSIMIALALTLFPSNHQQGTAYKCQPVDATQPTYFITFDHIKDEISTGMSQRFVYLRFHNNGSCRISLTSHDYPLMVEGKKKPTGGIILVPLDHIRNGAEVGLVYKLQDELKLERPFYPIPPHYIHVFDLLAGHSILFKVPIKYFREEQHIIVPFSEHRNGLYGLNTEMVSFFGGDLSKDLL